MPGYRGFTPLHLAAITGHLDIVKILLTYVKEDKNPKDIARITPLVYATIYKHYPIVDYIKNQIKCAS